MKTEKSLFGYLNLVVLLKNIGSPVLWGGWLGLLLMVSCEPDKIDISIDTPPSKLVVASQIIPNQIMVISLTRSISALSSETKGEDTVSANFLKDLLVKDALVTVSYFNKTDTLFMLTPGIYTSVNTLLNNYGVYTLKANDPISGMEITASSSILPFVPFDTIYPIVKMTNADTIVSVNVKFKDTPEVENYYVINYYKKVSGAGNGFDINSYFKLGSNKLLTDFELISDKVIDNNVYEKETQLSEVTANDTIAVAISNISKGYYDFLATYKKSGRFFNQIAGEPINYPSNVNNGYGFFNTHYPDARIFDLNNY